MRSVLDPFQVVVIAIAGWMNQHQHHVIEYLLEENRVLREQIGSRRMRFNDDQRRRLAVKAKRLSRKLLARVATIVTPETLLAWHRSPRNTMEALIVLPDDHERRLKLLHWSLAWPRRIEAGVIAGFKAH